MSEEEEEEMAAAASALGWSAQQTRILTANGKANEYYTAQRGFAFSETELPHYHLIRRIQRRRHDDQKDKKKDDIDDDDEHSSYCCNETHVMFRKWAAMQQLQQQQQHSSLLPTFSIVGAWKRTVFYNNEMDVSPEQRTSTDATETVYNIQTNTLFVDLRLPIATRQILHEQLLHLKPNSNTADSRRNFLKDLNAHQLRLYARQHVFAGFTRIQSVSSEKPKDTTTTSIVAPATPAPAAVAVVDAKLLCTRHHCIDWNFVGTPRARPNKWWVEPVVVVHEEEEENGNHGNTCCAAWNEWAYATNHQGQHYYCERWERLLNMPDGATASSSANYDDNVDHETQRLMDNLVLALRKMPSTTTCDDDEDGQEEQDGVIVCVGNHFNYCLYTQPKAIKDGNDDNKKFSSLVDLVDDAVARGDLDYARAWLGRIQAGHGYITTGSGWKVNAAIPQWHEEQQQHAGGGGGGNKKSPLWQSRDEVKVVLAAAASNHDNDYFSTATIIRSWTSDYCVSWKGELWKILECNLSTKAQLETILWLGLNASSRL